MVIVPGNNPSFITTYISGGTVNTRCFLVLHWWLLQWKWRNGAWKNATGNNWTGKNVTKKKLQERLTSKIISHERISQERMSEYWKSLKLGIEWDNFPNRIFIIQIVQIIHTHLDKLYEGVWVNNIIILTINACTKLNIEYASLVQHAVGQHA